MENWVFVSVIYSVCGGSLQMQSIPYVWNRSKNDVNGLYSQNVISVHTIMIDTQMWKRYPVSIHKADGVRGHGVTCVSDELPQMCSTPNFVYVDQCLQVTPEKKSNSVTVGFLTSHSTGPGLLNLFCPLVPDLWDTCICTDI